MTYKKLNLIFVLAVFLTPISCSKHIITGEYRTNFATYGMFGKTLTLNCDSSVIMNYAGDLINDNSYGNWEINEDTLILRFDTINYPNSRFRNDLFFVIKGNKLNNIPITKSRYSKLVRNIRESGSVNKVLSYERFVRNADINMVDNKGTMKRQYFVKIEELSCNKQK
jgi:hypothetical protein